MSKTKHCGIEESDVEELFSLMGEAFKALLKRAEKEIREEEDGTGRKETKKSKVKKKQESKRKTKTHNL